MKFAAIALALVMYRGLVGSTRFTRMALSSSAATAASSALKGLSSFGQSTRNSLLDYLVCEEGAAEKNQFMPRQIYKAHFTPTKPEPPTEPSLVIASVSCAESLGLSVEGMQTDAALCERFARAFAGADELPGLEEPYATVYGCHVYGSWFGQLGDGRAINLGEVENHKGNRFELQLKGGGRTPFSRGFDGKAVLRSCIREFLASEAMHHLGVPTTRALSIVATNQGVRRAWYVGATTDNLKNGSYEGRLSRPSGGGFPPDRVNLEPGAIMCRVSPSFLRVAQFELFAQRDEIPELVRFADYCCFREFPHLLSDPTLAMPAGPPSTPAALDETLLSRQPVPWSRGAPRRYVELYRCICRAVASLVAEWIRVGYVQGNMNSDNILLGGRTLDYGPFGWMESYNPLYQPFTSDMEGKFAFMRQPTAMLVNMVTLAQSFGVLLAAKCREAGLSAQEEASLQAELTAIGEKDFPDMFHAAFCEVRRRKLGLAQFREEDNLLWKDLDMLLFREGQGGGGGVDYTIFFRELCGVAFEDMSAGEALAALQAAFYEPQNSAEYKGPDVRGWTDWLGRYSSRLRLDGSGSERRDQRAAEMALANPKFILRNWMGILAYEAAEKGDLSVLDELHALLEKPYDEHEQRPDLSDKWYRRTPGYAKAMPGAAFMS